MTIDERVEAYLAKSVNYQMAAEGIKHIARQGLKSLLLEVARDQREACAKAIAHLPVDTCVGGNTAYHAVMNATLEAK